MSKGKTDAERRKAQRAQARAYVYSYLSHHPCIRCGLDDPRALTFHHRNPEEKVANVARMVSSAVSLQTIALEIAKCDVLCANCHLILHAEEREV